MSKENGFPDRNADWKTNQDQHWKIISGGGVVISNTAEQLWKQAVSYFEWCEMNPIQVKRTLTSGKEAGKLVTIEYTRPYTIKALCLHCGFSERYIQDIKNTYKPESEYYIVMEKILMLIYNQNLEGALIDIYNPMMVSKVLNMDKPQDTEAQVVKVEMIGSISNELANSENEVLKKLDFGKVENLKEKLENS